MGEIMPMADALAVWAEEGRVYERDTNGEPSNRRYQPLISEWSNPSGSNIRDPLIYQRRGTRGTETSKYPEEKKSYRDSVSSGERKRISLNPRRKSGVLRDCNIRLNICKRMNWKVQPKKVKALYLTRMFTVAVSQVPRDTENLVGIWVGHDPRLKTQTDR